MGTLAADEVGSRQRSWVGASFVKASRRQTRETCARVSSRAGVNSRPVEVTAYQKEQRASRSLWRARPLLRFLRCDSRRAGAHRCLTCLDGEAGGPQENGALLLMALAG